MARHLSTLLLDSYSYSKVSNKLIFLRPPNGSMRYTKFEIENFKGIQSLSVNLAEIGPNARVFTFVGLNESGKTSILEAINFLGEDFSENTRHLLIPRNKTRNFNGNVSVKCELQLDNNDERTIKFYANHYGLNTSRAVGKISISKIYKFKGSKFVEEVSSWDINLIGKKKRSRT